MIPSVKQLSAEIARKRKFGLILDEPLEAGGGRHFFISRTKDDLLADAIDWLNEAPGPSTAGYIKNLTVAISVLHRGQTAYLKFVRVH